MSKDAKIQHVKRTALYGGAFDPVHTAHLALAELALQSGVVDTVVFLPAAQSPLKEHGAVASDEQRLAMLELALADQLGMRVDDYELRKGGVSYTVDTLRHFREVCPDERFYWILGADQFEQLDRWRAIEALCHLTDFLVFARPGYSLHEPPVGAQLSYEILEAPLMPQSSSTIRRNLTSGELPRDWLPGAVEAFISEHGLYN